MAPTRTQRPFKAALRRRQYTLNLVLAWCWTRWGRRCGRRRGVPDEDVALGSFIARKARGPFGLSCSGVAGIARESLSISRDPIRSHARRAKLLLWTKR